LHAICFSEKINSQLGNHSDAIKLSF